MSTTSTEPATTLPEPSRGPAAKPPRLARAIPALQGLALLVLGYLLPSFFFSRHIATLTGGALWFPPAWRSAITLFVVVIGGCCFVVARDAFRKGGVLDPNLRTESTSEQRRPRRLRRLGWPWPPKIIGAAVLLAALGCMSLQFDMRHRFIRTLTPSPGVLARVLLAEERNARDVELDEELSQRLAALPLPEGQYLELGPHGATLRLIVPPLAWMPERYVELLAEWERRYPEAPFPRGADAELGRLLDVLEADEQSRRATSRIIHLFLLVHTLVICLASTGYGIVWAVTGNLLQTGAHRMGTTIGGFVDT